MKIASFLCLLALGVLTTSPEAPARDVAERALSLANTAETITPQGIPGDRAVVASAAITAKECRVYAHIRDNIVSKLEKRRLKGRCSVDEFRQRDA